MTRLARRLGVLAGALALVTLLWGCGTGAVRAPGEETARVVPADALAYVHLSLDAGDGAVAQLRSTAQGLPGFGRLVGGLERRLEAITSTRYATQVHPWLGSEAALAFVPDGATASELIVLRVRDRRLARSFVSQVRGAAARLVDGCVVIGEPSVVAAVGRGRSLAQDPAFTRVLGAEPADRVLDAYGTGRGLAELLDGRSGLAGVGAALLSLERPHDVALALAPTGDGLRAWVRMTGPGLGRSPSFRASLAGHLPANTSWVAQVPSLTGSAPGMLSVLAAASGGSGGGAASERGLTSRLGPALTSEGVDLRTLAALFDHPSAVFDVDSDVGVMTTTTHPTAARRALGAAGGALAELFAPGGPGGGTQPLVSTESVHDVAVTSYQQPDGAQFDLAVFDGVIVATTSERAIAAIIDQKASLSGQSLYRSVLAGLGPAAGPVLFGAINRLVRSGDQAGLLQSLGLSGIRAALARISAAGLTSRGGYHQTTSELYFTIS